MSHPAPGIKHNTRDLDLQCAQTVLQDNMKKTCEQTRYDIQNIPTSGPRAVWIFDTRNMANRNTFRQDNVQNIHTVGSLICGNIARATRSTLRHEDLPAKTSGFLPHFLGANTRGSSQCHSVKGCSMATSCVRRLLSCISWPARGVDEWTPDQP